MDLGLTVLCSSPENTPVYKPSKCLEGGGLWGEENEAEAVYVRSRHNAVAPVSLAFEETMERTNARETRSTRFALKNRQQQSTTT